MADNQAAPAWAAPDAEVSADATLGPGTKVWPHAVLREGVAVGANCIISRGAYLGPGVRLGDGCKVKDSALVYEPASADDGVFIGPAAVLTNDLHPRAVNPDLSPKGSDDWTMVGVHLGQGASIGARAVCVAPVRIGRWAMIAAGAVVIRDVPDFALMVGTPARQVGWVGRTGRRLSEVSPDRWQCPDTGEVFQFDGVGLSEASE